MNKRETYGTRAVYMDHAVLSSSVLELLAQQSQLGGAVVSSSVLCMHGLFVALHVYAWGRRWPPCNKTPQSIRSLFIHA
jgi:hypothetical protein